MHIHYFIFFESLNVCWFNCTNAGKDLKEKLTKCFFDRVSFTFEIFSADLSSPTALSFSLSEDSDAEDEVSELEPSSSKDLKLELPTRDWSKYSKSSMFSILGTNCAGCCNNVSQFTPAKNGWDFTSSALFVPNLCAGSIISNFWIKSWASFDKSSGTRGSYPNCPFKIF